MVYIFQKSSPLRSPPMQGAAKGGFSFTCGIGGTGRDRVMAEGLTKHLTELNSAAPIFQDEQSSDNFYILILRTIKQWMIDHTRSRSLPEESLNEAAQQSDFSRAECWS